MNKPEVVEINYFSDLLCVWAYVAEARVEELDQAFGSQVRINRRYCSVFGDSADKIGNGWQAKGGYDGFARHVHEVARQFGHVDTHPGLWTELRPPSSSPAHLFLKAVELIEDKLPGSAPDASNRLVDTLSWDLRLAFFRDGKDIARWEILAGLAKARQLDADAIQAQLHSGAAYAALAADERSQQDMRIEGSPTFVLNNGRQKLYGNVGYRVLEANVRELLNTPDSGEASWC